MIKISNGITDKEVTKGAYKNFYEHLGYKIVGNEEKPKREVEVKPEIKEEVKKEVKEKVVIKDNEDKGEKKSQKIEEFKKR
jgi:hypothetical protein